MIIHQHTDCQPKGQRSPRADLTHPPPTHRLPAQRPTKSACRSHMTVCTLPCSWGCTYVQTGKYSNLAKFMQSSLHCKGLPKCGRVTSCGAGPSSPTPVLYVVPKSVFFSSVTVLSYILSVLSVCMSSVQF